MAQWQIMLGFLCLWLTPLEAQGQLGNIISSVGAINQSMGGAATAMPLDASGSQYWNPAGITDLEETELDLNIQPFFIHTNLTASLNANTLAPGLPSITLSNTLRNRANLAIAPSIGFVKKMGNSPWRWGILATGIGGAAVHYPQDENNPVTTSPPIGLGYLKITGKSLQISASAAYQLNQHWSIGIQPNLDLAALQAEPFAGAKPVDNNQDGIPTYPKVNNAWAVGFGVQGGVYYHRRDLHLGASIKSPQWFTPYHFRATYENGHTTRITTRSNSPMIVSGGIGYSGIPRMKIAIDTRFIDFANTTGYSQVGFTSKGAVRGPGWKSIWALASGIQYQLNPKCSVRIGYAFTPTPIRPIYTSFSISSASVVEQQLSVGLSYQMNKRFTLAAAYLHDFANSRQGPLQSPTGPIPSSSIKLKSALDSIVFSLLFKF